MNNHIRHATWWDQDLEFNRTGWILPVSFYKAKCRLLNGRFAPSNPILCLERR